MSKTRKQLVSIDPDALPKHFDAGPAEARWDAFWQEQGTYRYDPSRPREENFVIDTPPLTASCLFQPRREQVVTEQSGRGAR